MEVWRRNAIGGDVASNHYSVAADVAVDAAGDVVAVGLIDSFPRVAVVVKLSGTDGSEIWRYPITDDGFLFRSVKIDVSGDVVASGTVGAAPDASIVVKLAGTDGDELWRRDIADPKVTTIDLDPAGDVFAAGYSAAAYGILKLAAGTGTGLWRHDGEPPLLSVPPALAALPTGDVITSGPGATVVRLAGIDGSELCARR
jgi:outer membrane protein assembly factor BamB